MQHGIMRTSRSPRVAAVAGIFISGLLGGIPCAVAQPAAVIGIVNTQEAFEESISGQKASEAIKEHISARDKIVDTDKEELKALREEIQKSESLDEEARAAKQEQFQRKFQKFQERQQTFQQEIRQKQDTMMNEYLKKVKVAAEAVAKRQGLSVIMDNGSILYITQGMDITEDVVKELDTLYP